MLKKKRHSNAEACSTDRKYDILFWAWDQTESIICVPNITGNGEIKLLKTFYFINTEGRDSFYQNVFESLRFVKGKGIKNSRLYIFVTKEHEMFHITSAIVIDSSTHQNTIMKSKLNVK